MSLRENRLSVVEWDAELAKLRGTDTERPSTAVCSALRHRFQRISQSAKSHNESPQLGSGGIPALNDLRSSALELMLLAHEELAAFEQPDKPAIPVDCLDRLLSDIAARHTELDSYLNVIQFGILTAELVGPAILELLNGGEVSAQRFRPVVEQLSDETRSVDLVTLAPLSAVAWDRIDANSLPGWFCAAAIPAVQWTAVLTKNRHHHTPHLRDAEIMAALLCDVGQLVLSPGHGPRRILSAVEYHRHPEISAAVMAGISDAAAEWPLIAGQHHERCDGTGFPRKFSGRQLGTSSRVLSTVVRWVELLKTKAATSAPLDAIASAAVTLWKETLVGGFDSAIVKDLLATVRSELPAAAQSAVMQGTRLKLDSAHTQLAGPHVPIAGEMPKVRITSAASTRISTNQS